MRFCQFSAKNIYICDLDHHRYHEKQPVTFS